jgi:hypothetical protein
LPVLFALRSANNVRQGIADPRRQRDSLAALPQSLEFEFWVGGLVIFPVVLIYTGPFSGSFAASWVVAHVGCMVAWNVT